MLANGHIGFKVGLQSLTAQSKIKVEHVAATLTIKGAVFCSNMKVELGFEKGFGSVPLHLGNTSILHVAGNRTYSPRAKHIVLRHFFVQKLVEEGKITIHYLNTQDQLAGLTAKHLGRHRHRVLIKLVNDFEA